MIWNKSHVYLYELNIALIVVLQGESNDQGRAWVNMSIRFNVYRGNRALFSPSHYVKDVLVKRMLRIIPIQISQRQPIYTCSRIRAE